MGCGSSEIPKNLQTDEENNHLIQNHNLSSINDENYFLKKNQEKYNNIEFNNDIYNNYKGKGREIPFQRKKNLLNSRENSFRNNNHKNSFIANQFNRNKSNYYIQSQSISYPKEKNRNKSLTPFKYKRNNNDSLYNYYQIDDNYSRKKISVNNSTVINVPEYKNNRLYNDNSLIQISRDNNFYENSIYKLNYNNQFNKIEEELFDQDNNIQEYSTSTLNKPNYLNLRFHCIQTIKVSNSEITCLILLTQTNELASGSTDYLIKIFKNDMNGNYKLSSILKGHLGSIICLKEFVKTNTLISCSVDNTLKLWDIETLNCYMTLYGHKKSVLCCDVCDNKYDYEIISGGDDCNIIIWASNSIDNYSKKFALIGHENSIVCLLYIKNFFYLASGSDDLTIRIWDAERDYICIKIFNAINSEIYCMRYKKNRLISSCEDGNIYFFNLLVLKKIRSVQFSYSAVNDFDIIDQEKYLISASNDCKGRIWLIGTNERAILKGHTRALSSIIYIERGLIATSSLDGAIKIWCKE